MTRHTRLLTGLVIAAIAALSTAPALADEKADLKKRFEERYPRIQELKKDGLIGETYLGYIDAVKPENAGEDDVKKLIGEENNDRRRLYEIIAKEQNTTADLVGRRNGQRNFRLARADDWLLPEDGRWVRKKDLK